MEEVDAEISEMKLFLNGRARFVAEGYLAQVIAVLAFYANMPDSVPFSRRLDEIGSAMY